MAAKAKTKVALEATTKKKEKRKRNKKKNNNNNQKRYVELITDSIMKGVIISPGDSEGMTTDFRTFKKSAAAYAAAYAAAKVYGYWPGVIENLEPIPDKEWKTKSPNKSQYALKRTTKVETEGAADIMKQEWIVTDYEKQEELEDNYNNKLRPKFAKQALYFKSSAMLYIVFYGQLHSDIVTIAKRSTTPFFETVHKERDVDVLLICVKNLSRSKVDPYFEQLKILSSTLSHAKTKGISNHNFGDAIYDQVLAAQSQCGVFAFNDNYHAKVLSGDSYTSLRDYFSFDQTKKDKLLEYKQQHY